MSCAAIRMIKWLSWIIHGLWQVALEGSWSSRVEWVLKKENFSWLFGVSFKKLHFIDFSMINCTCRAIIISPLFVHAVIICSKRYRNSIHMSSFVSLFFCQFRVFCNPFQNQFFSGQVGRNGRGEADKRNMSQLWNSFFSGLCVVLYLFWGWKTEKFSHAFGCVTQTDGFRLPFILLFATLKFSNPKWLIDETSAFWLLRKLVPSVWQVAILCARQIQLFNLEEKYWKTSSW